MILACSCVETFFLGTRRPREIVLAASGVGALLANPGGLYNVEDLIRHLHVQDVVVISEFLPPTFARERAFFFLAPLVLILSWRVRRDWPALLGVVGPFAVLAFRSGRMVYEFELVGTLALALAIGWCRDEWGAGAARLLLGALVVSLSLWRIEWLVYAQSNQQFHEQRLPVRAVDFVRAERLDGRFFNSFGDGGYLEWMLPEFPAFQDARPMAFSPDFFARERAAHRSPQDFRRWLSEWGVEWALVSRTEQFLSGLGMMESPEWALIYWDEKSELYVRRDVARFASLISRFEYRRFRPTGDFIRGLPTASREELSSWLGEIERFQRTAPLVVEASLLRCGLLRRLGAAEQSEFCEKAERVIGNERQAALLAIMYALPLASQ
jgi:hypothetical protein